MTEAELRNCVIEGQMDLFTDADEDADEATAEAVSSEK